jgi:Mrp family chromosome partitioning ATPase
MIPSLHLFNDQNFDQGPFSDLEFLQNGIIGNIPISAKKNPLDDIVFDQAVAGYVMLQQFLTNLKKYNGNTSLVLNAAGETKCSQTVFLNIVTTMAADPQARILLLDCNLRSPENLAGQFGLTPGPGFVDFLEGRCTLEMMKTKTDRGNVDFIGSGCNQINPYRLLMSDKFIALLNHLKKQYHFLLVNSPPYGRFVDAFIMTKFIQPTVFLFWCDDNSHNLAEIRDEFSVLGTRVVGFTASNE